MSFWCLQIDQKPMKFLFCKDLFPSLYKKRLNQKKNALYFVFNYLNIVLFFLFCLFLEARAEILTKILLLFLVDLKAPKGHFEIN